MEEERFGGVGQKCNYTRWCALAHIMMLGDDKTATAHDTHTHTHADNSGGCDGCPDADPLQAENRWAPFLFTKWQMVPGCASRELVTRTLLAARLITPPWGPDDKTKQREKKKGGAHSDMIISCTSFRSFSQAWMLSLTSTLLTADFQMELVTIDLMCITDCIICAITWIPSS